MTVLFSGGCACGAIRYACAGAPLALLNCRSGALASRSFCSECGSPLFTRGEAAPGFMSIRFSTLDDQSTFKPMLDIGTSSAQPWVCRNEGIPHYPKSP